MKLPCGCEHDGESYCACGEPICIDHHNPDNVNEDREIECDECAKATKEIAEILEPADPGPPYLLQEVRRLMKDAGFEQRVIDSLAARLDPETGKHWQFRIIGDAEEHQAFDLFIEAVIVKHEVCLPTGSGKTAAPKNNKEEV